MFNLGPDVDDGTVPPMTQMTVMKILIPLVCQSMTYLLQSEINLQDQKRQHESLLERVDALTMLSYQSNLLGGTDHNTPTFSKAANPAHLNHSNIRDRSRFGESPSDSDRTAPMHTSPASFNVSTTMLAGYNQPGPRAAANPSGSGSSMSASPSVIGGDGKGDSKSNALQHWALSRPTSYTRHTQHQHQEEGQEGQEGVATTRAHTFTYAQAPPPSPWPFNNELSPVRAAGDGLSFSPSSRSDNLSPLDMSYLSSPAGPDTGARAGAEGDDVGANSNMHLFFGIADTSMESPGAGDRNGYGRGNDYGYGYGFGDGNDAVKTPQRSKPPPSFTVASTPSRAMTGSGTGARRDSPAPPTFTPSASPAPASKSIEEKGDKEGGGREGGGVGGGLEWSPSRGVGARAAYPTSTNNPTPSPSPSTFSPPTERLRGAGAGGSYSLRSVSLVPASPSTLPPSPSPSISLLGSGYDTKASKASNASPSAALALSGRGRSTHVTSPSRRVSLGSELDSDFGSGFESGMRTGMGVGVGMGMGMGLDFGPQSVDDIGGFGDLDGDPNRGGRVNRELFRQTPQKMRHQDVDSAMGVGGMDPFYTPSRASARDPVPTRATFDTPSVLAGAKEAAERERAKRQQQQGNVAKGNVPVKTVVGSGRADRGGGQDKIVSSSDKPQFQPQQRVQWADSDVEDPPPPPQRQQQQSTGRGGGNDAPLSPRPPRPPTTSSSHSIGAVSSPHGHGPGPGPDPDPNVSTSAAPGPGPGPGPGYMIGSAASDWLFASTFSQIGPLAPSQSKPKTAPSSSSPTTSSSPSSAATPAVFQAVRTFQAPAKQTTSLSSPSSPINSIGRGPSSFVETYISPLNSTRFSAMEGGDGEFDDEDEDEDEEEDEGRGDDVYSEAVGRLAAHSGGVPSTPLRPSPTSPTTSDGRGQWEPVASTPPHHMQQGKQAKYGERRGAEMGQEQGSMLSPSGRVPSPHSQPRHPFTR